MRSAFLFVGLIWSVIFLSNCSFNEGKGVSKIESIRTTYNGGGLVAVFLNEDNKRSIFYRSPLLADEKFVCFDSLESETVNLDKLPRIQPNSKEWTSLVSMLKKIREHSLDETETRNAGALLKILENYGDNRFYDEKEIVFGD